jgi:hypothetical protein
MYWDTAECGILDMSKVGRYENYLNMVPTTPEGYTCDELKPSDVVFLGSCDLNGPIEDPSKSWARLLHANLADSLLELPYISLAKSTAGFMSFPRRLITYCEKYGAPKHVYAVVPRPVSVEVPLSEGNVVSVSNRVGFPNYLFKRSALNDLDYSTLREASKFYQSQINNIYYQLYQFEQTASFLSLICRFYNIDFKWTLNLSSSAIAYYNKYLIEFFKHSLFMKQTFVGLASAVDFTFDGSMGEGSQDTVYRLFKDRPSFDFLNLEQNLQNNLNIALLTATEGQLAL